VGNALTFAPAHFALSRRPTFGKGNALGMKRALGLFFLLMVCGCGALRADPPDVSSDLVRTLAGETTVHLSFVTTATPDKIWKALTSADELTKWAAPLVKVDFRVGGAYEYYFYPKHSEGHRGMEGTKILCYVPSKMLAHTGALVGTWVVWTIEPAGDQQAVHYYIVGNSSEWNDSAAARGTQALEFVEKLAKYLQP
jgi:uncharacterized protein YndB with AHSA1/START domain